MPGFKRVHRGEGACNKPSTFVIPLKPVERGQEVDDRALQQAVQKEYAEGYLKSLGARPTRQNLELLRENLTLKDGNVTARLRGQGYARDEMHVTAPAVKHDARTGITLMPAKGMIRIAATNEMLTDKEIDDEREQALLNGAKVPDLKEGGADAKFTHAVSRYMYPFFLEPSLVRTREQELALALEPPADFSVLDAKVLAVRHQTTADVFSNNPNMSAFLERRVAQVARQYKRSGIVPDTINRMGDSFSLRRPGSTVQRSIDKRLSTMRRGIAAKLISRRFDAQAGDEEFQDECNKEEDDAGDDMHVRPAPEHSSSDSEESLLSTAGPPPAAAVGSQQEDSESSHQQQQHQQQESRTSSRSVQQVVSFRRSMMRQASTIHRAPSTPMEPEEKEGMNALIRKVAEHTGSHGAILGELRGLTQRCKDTVVLDPILWLGTEAADHSRYSSAAPPSQKPRPSNGGDKSVKFKANQVPNGMGQLPTEHSMEHLSHDLFSHLEQHMNAYQVQQEYSEDSGVDRDAPHHHIKDPLAQHLSQAWATSPTKDLPALLRHIQDAAHAKDPSRHAKQAWRLSATRSTRSSDTATEKNGGTGLSVGFVEQETVEEAKRRKSIASFGRFKGIISLAMLQAKKTPAPPPNEEAESAEIMGVSVQLLDELLVEMAQVMDLRPEVLLDFQSEFESALTAWFSGLSAETRKGRLTQVELEAVCEEMATDEALQLFCTTILYFWDKYVRTSKYFDKRRFDTKQYVVWATSPASSYDCAMAALKEANDMDSVFDYQQETAAQARQENRLFGFHARFSELSARLRSSQVGLFFGIPVFVLALRSLVDSLFRAVYPLWVRTQEGYNALAAMDKDILAWTDPHGYHRNITILQSSPAAVRVVLQQPRASHKPCRAHFNDVSPLVAAALSKPTSCGARRVMFQNHRLTLFGRQETDDRHIPPLKYHDLAQDVLSKSLPLSKREALLRGRLQNFPLTSQDS